MRADLTTNLPLLFQSPQRRTWSQAAERFYALGTWKARQTRLDEERIFKELRPDLAAVDLHQVHAGSISDLVEKWIKGEVGTRTINRRLEVIRAVLRAAASWGWIFALPFIKLLPKGPKRIRWLSPAQAAKLLRLLPSHQRPIAAFALETGLRKRNILELTWDRVDLQQRLVWIPPGQFKTRRPHAVPLSDEAEKIVRRQWRKHETHVFSFRGKPIKETNTKAWRAALKKLGVEDFHYHDLRHTWASWHAQSGTPLQVIQELGGWSSPAMVSVYAHLATDHLRPHVETISRMRQRALPEGRRPRSAARRLREQSE